MDFCENILKTIGIEESALAPTFKGYFIGDKIVYLQGVKRIVGFSDKTVSVQLKNKRIDVNGNCLSIKKYCSGDMVICGNVSGIQIY